MKFYAREFSIGVLMALLLPACDSTGIVGLVMLGIAAVAGAFGLRSKFGKKDAGSQEFSKTIEATTKKIEEDKKKTAGELASNAQLRAENAVVREKKDLASDSETAGRLEEVDKAGGMPTELFDKIEREVNRGKK